MHIEIRFFQKTQLLADI